MPADCSVLRTPTILIDTVSYTHLDVYKRQVRRRRLFCCVEKESACEEQMLLYAAEQSVVDRGEKIRGMREWKLF